MTGEAHGAVVTDPAVTTQVFLWHEGCIFVYIYIYFFFLSFFWLCWVFVAVFGLFSSCGKRGCSRLRYSAFLWWLLLLWLSDSRAQAR